MNMQEMVKLVEFLNDECVAEMGLASFNVQTNGEDFWINMGEMCVFYSGSDEVIRNEGEGDIEFVLRVMLLSMREIEEQIKIIKRLNLANIEKAIKEDK